MFNLYSDLHLDCSMCTIEGPALVAGDIDGLPTLVGSTEVYSIKGNHDFWHGLHNTKTVGTELRNEAVKLSDGRTLFGGTMWTEWAWPLSFSTIKPVNYEAKEQEIKQHDREIFVMAQGLELGARMCRNLNPDMRMPENEFANAIRAGSKYMNDYRYGRQPGDSGLTLRPTWAMGQYSDFLEKLTSACMSQMGDWDFQDDLGRPTAPEGEDKVNHMLVMSHHCPISRSVILRHYQAQRYDAYPQLYPAYYSPAIARLLMVDAHFRKSVRNHGMTWVYGHTHEAVDLLIYPFRNVKHDDINFYVHNHMADTYQGAQELEFEWEVERESHNPCYVDRPGVIRVVSNPRGYTRVEDYDQHGKKYTGIKV